MGKSINPMLSLDYSGSEACSPASGIIVLMSLQPAIPWQVVLQQSLPPLHQPVPFSTDRLNL